MGPLKRFEQNFASRVTLPAAAIATAMCAACLAVIWFDHPDGQEEMDRYGHVWQQLWRMTTAAALFEERRITLTVIANRLTEMDEIAGRGTFFDQSDELMAIEAVQQSNPASFDAQATIDDTQRLCASHPASGRHSPRQYLEGAWLLSPAKPFCSHRP